MESWQINHITTNLPALIKLTTCNTALLSRLTAKGFLSDSDLEELNAIANKMDKSYLLLKILMTRKAYFELIEALDENGQTGACEILHRGAIQNKIVRFQTQDISLSYILNHYNVPIPETTEKPDYNLLKQGVPVLVNNRVHPSPTYYIQRVICLRQHISSDIFQSPGNEIFVLKGLQRHELTNFAYGLDTDESSNQLKHVTVQFIFLELDSHFDKISSKTINPVHLIEYSADKKFNWLKTNGSLEKIRKFVKDEGVQLSEHEFIQECLQPNRPVCIADSPGMGKSSLLTKMAQTIMDDNPLQLVRFLHLQDFLLKFKPPVTQELLVNEIAEISSDYKIGCDLVAKALKSQITYLFLDGFDEISSDQVPIVAEILRCASELKETRVIAATRLHLKQELEDMVGGLGFTMLPFQENEQIDFLVKFWQEKVGGSSERLQEFARVCLDSLKAAIGEQTIAGIPLICRIIAEIYQDDAEEHSKSGLNKQPSLSRTISSIFEMYQVFMKDGFSKIDSHNSWWTIRKQSLKVVIKSHHVSLAVEELLPDKRDVLEPFLVKSGEDNRNLLFLPGILEPSSDNTSFRFVHRTFAEYLVAELIAEVIRFPNTPFHENWLTSIFSRSIYDNPVMRNEIWKLFFENVLATRDKIDSIPLKIGREVTVNSYEFEQPTICYFLNAFFAQNPLIQSSETALAMSHLPDFVKMYTAAVVSDKPAIAKLLAGIFESACENLPWSELFLLAAKYAGVQMMRQLTKLIHTSSGKHPADLKYSEVQGTPITPLHIAAQKGDYSLFEYLWNNGGFRLLLIEEHENAQFNLLHECVRGTSSETLEVVEIRKQIISLMSSNDTGTLHKITEERLPHDNS